jgi:acyl dehydratase
MARNYFEDAEVGSTRSSGPYLIKKDEIVEFARKFDPAPRHVDEEAANKSVFKGLTASGAHTFAIVISLAGKTKPGLHILAGLGWDELRLPLPVRPGDELMLDATVVEKRASDTRSDRGIVRSRIQLRNQKGEVVFSATSTVLVANRPAS